MLVGHVVAITPFRPRAPVIAHARIARELERDIRMRRAIPTLAVRNDLRIGMQAQRLELGAQLFRRLDVTFRRVTCGPIAMHRAWYRAAAPRPHELAEILRIAAHIENLD